MSDGIVILTLQDRERWTREHCIDGLPSQSWNYAWGLSAAGVDPRLAVVRAGGARMLLPFIERPWLDTVDIATILGMSGASIVPAASPAPLLLWQEYAKSRGWISGYIQLAAAVDFPADIDVGQLVANNTTFILDIAAGDIAISASRTIRQKIKAGIKRGVALVIDQSQLVECVQRLHPQTMRRVAAERHYFYPGEAFERWLDAESLALGARTENGLEAVYVFRIAGAYAEAHLAASTEQGRELLPWLIWHGIRLMRERGVSTLDLGGSPQAGGGLYRFKERFGGTPKTIKAVHQIYDRSRFAELCRLAGAAETGRWFPPYRGGPEACPPAPAEPAGINR